MSLPIIYITGATACGKSTLGKRLAREWNLYHISLGDVRRDYDTSIMAGVPWMPKPIRQHINNREVIPSDLLDKYEHTPVILLYYNRRVRGRHGWSTNLACSMLDEVMTRASTIERVEGTYHGFIIDGHPLTTGNVSEEVVEHYKSRYGGYTIVIDSPREVAKQRYIERARMPTENEATFEHRMELTDKVLSKFIELMAGHGKIVRFTNDATMTIDEAFKALVSELESTVGKPVSSLNYYD